MVEETGIPRQSHRPWMGDHYPATCRHWGSNRVAAVTGERFISALSKPTLPLGARGWLRLVIMALPGRFNKLFTAGSEAH